MFYGKKASLLPDLSRYPIPYSSALLAKKVLPIEMVRSRFSVSQRSVIISKPRLVFQQAKTAAPKQM
jgi:hypothetical protein